MPVNTATDRLVTAGDGPIVIVYEETDHSDLLRKVFPDREVNTVPLSEFVRPDFVFPDRELLVIVDCARITDEILVCIEALQLTHPSPVLVFTETGDAATAQAALRAGASSCVFDGLQAHRIEVLVAVTIERFRQSREMQDELKRTRDAVEARKFIERAKGILMKSRSIPEDEAYRMIRSTAMKQSKSMREVAESILAVADIF